MAGISSSVPVRTRPGTLRSVYNEESEFSVYESSGLKSWVTSVLKQRGEKLIYQTLTKSLEIRDPIKIYLPFLNKPPKCVLGVRIGESRCSS